MTPVFKWSGEYFGFIHDENLFHADGAYSGWIEDGQAWASDGAYLAEVRHGGVEFCDFDGEIRGSLVFTI